MIILIIISILTIRINKDVKDKNRISVAVDESFPKDVSNETEEKIYQSDSQIGSIKYDDKSIIENTSSIAQKDPMHETPYSNNFPEELKHDDYADKRFLEMYEPFLQRTGVSQDKIEEIYNLYMQASMEISDSLLYMQETIELDDVELPASEEDSKLRDEIIKNFEEEFKLRDEINKKLNDNIIDVLGETDGEKYKFFTISLSERMLINKLNSNLDNENQLDNNQIDELVNDFYNIRVKYYDIKNYVGEMFEIKGKWEGNQTPEEIDAIIENEYFDSAEKVLTKTQLENLKSIYDRR